jgi:hypothetical protein
VCFPPCVFLWRTAKYFLKFWFLYFFSSLQKYYFVLYYNMWCIMLKFGRFWWSFVIFN